MMKNTQKKTSVVKRFGAVAAALALVVSGFAVYQSNNAVASMVMLDVNPGIEISVNKGEEVLAVTPKNEDAKTVIGNMDFSGSKLEVALNAIIGSMLRNGYISEDSNSVLLSVDSKNAAAAQVMQTRLMNEINRIMEGENVSGAVLAQTVTEDSALQALADQYGITLGKAKLIDQITKQNTLYSFKDLVPLTINELNLISESGGTKLENVVSIGTASSSNYIGQEKAKELALQKAGVSAANANVVRCELDWENMGMVYEVDVKANGIEHEVTLNATTGAVLKYETERDDDYRPATGTQQTAAQTGTQQTGTSEKDIGRDAAVAAAYAKWNIPASSVAYYECELERSHGVLIYEVDFVANGNEYECDVRASDGAVIKYSVEKDDGKYPWKNTSAPAASQQQQTTTPAAPQQQQTTTPAAPQQQQTTTPAAPQQQTTTSGQSITRDQAISKTKAYFGLSSSAQVWDVDVEWDYERGQNVVEVSFNYGNREYEASLNPTTGAVLWGHSEYDD